LVFDLGGGTLDATVLEIHRGREYRTIATDGEVRLGGHDWDARLRDHLVELFQTKTGVDPLGTPRGKTEFLQYAERMKLRLSEKETAELPCKAAGKSAVLKVERATFEHLTSDLVLRARTMAQMVLDQAGRTWNEVQTVLAVGGSTRMPMIGRMLEQLTGRPPDQSLSVDEAVAHGAVIYGHLKFDPGGVRVVNVNSHTYRVLAKRPEGVLFAKPLIPKNSPLPAAGSYLFTAKSQGTGTARIEVYEGEDDDQQFCTRIGKVVVDGLHLSGDKKWLVQVRLRCREDGNLEVAAAVRDPADTAKIVQRVEATLEPAHGMTREQVAASREWVESLTVS
jgi:molecular chaperone DnaK